MQLSSDVQFVDWVLKTMRELGFTGTRMDIGIASECVLTSAENRMDACQGVLEKKDLAKNRLESMTYADWHLFDSADSGNHAVH